MKHFVWNVRNCEYNEKRFKAVICRLKDPIATALIFENGKVVVTGTKSETLCRAACCHFAKLIKKYHHDNTHERYKENALSFVFKKSTSIKIENIVAKVDLEKEINLECFGHYKVETKIGNEKKEEYKQSITVEFVPETFPGVIWRNVEKDVTA